MKINNPKQILFYFLILGVISLVLFSFTIASVIGKAVKTQCQHAMRVYEGECVEALISLLKDENQNFRARNSAIWALGQLGDSRALPVLQSFYTGEIPDREPLDQTISQYELKKAINLTSGGFNITAFIWRYDFN